MDVSTKDIAKRLGVSPSTVSRALQGKLVSDEMINKVRQLAEELNYRPNIGARMMVSGKVGMYGLLVPSTVNPYFGSAVEIFQSAAFKQGYYINLGVYMEDLEEFRKYIELLVKERRVDGLIIFPMHDPHILEILAAMAREKVPIVLLAKTLIEGIHWVDVELEKAGREMALHLIGQGHRRIGLIQGGYARDRQVYMVSSFRDTRVSGLEHAMIERGIPWSAQELLITTETTVKAGYDAARSLLALQSRPTAIFAINDLLAFGAMQAAHDLGLRVPEDLSVAGFDNTFLSASLNLTSADMRLDQMAEYVLDILHRANQEDYDRTVAITRSVMPELVIRGSTGPAPEV